ncbi:hypothetical protein [Sulfurovum sp.]|uniref:hypothetical protein n=1 Tax=Sulfurovum sp. TaxID=1969726 RepID=UPI003567B892
MSSDAIGEYYCLCELLLDGKEAYLANGLTQKGWDIAVLDGNKTIRVQVKCINWEASGQAAVKGTFITKEFDYLVIVLLRYKGSKFTPLVIPYEKLKEKSEDDRGKLIDDDGYVYYSSKKEKKSGNSYEKQAIAISTLENEEIFNLFGIYNANFGSIKA